MLKQIVGRMLALLRELIGDREVTKRRTTRVARRRHYHA